MAKRIRLNAIRSSPFLQDPNCDPRRDRTPARLPPRTPPPDHGRCGAGLVDGVHRQFRHLDRPARHPGLVWAARWRRPSGSHGAYLLTLSSLILVGGAASPTGSAPCGSMARASLIFVAQFRDLHPGAEHGPAEHRPRRPRRGGRLHGAGVDDPDRPRLSARRTWRSPRPLGRRSHRHHRRQARCWAGSC